MDNDVTFIETGPTDEIIDIGQRRACCFATFLFLRPGLRPSLAEEPTQSTEVSQAVGVSQNEHLLDLTSNQAGTDGFWKQTNIDLLCSVLAVTPTVTQVYVDTKDSLKI